MNSQGGRQVERGGGREWNHLRSEEPSRELDCMLLVGVIVKAEKAIRCSAQKCYSPPENSHKRSGRR